MSRLRDSTSSANTPMMGMPKASVRLARTARSSRGEARKSQTSVRRYQRWEESQPPSQAVPFGSVSGNSQARACCSGRSSFCQNATIAMTTHATSPNAHSGMSSRRNRSRSTVRARRRCSDLARRLPDTKNMAGMAATK